jgi:hypothetical protein
MMNSACTNPIPKNLFVREHARWLVGMAMMATAYLIEKTLLRLVR